MAKYILSLLVLSSSLFFNQERIQAQSIDPVKVTFYWDVSYSMQKRNLEGEFEVLEKFFSSKQNAIVNYVAFSNSITGREQHKVNNGDWTSLRRSLEGTIYDGATDFNTVSFTDGAQHYILSTDGHSIYNELTTKSIIPITVIQSVGSEKTTRLKLLANGSRGGYFGKIPPKSQYNAEKKSINGIVTGRTESVLGPVENVRIQIEGSDQGTYTAKDGSFSLDVSQGSILVFSYVGKQSKRIRIGDKSTINLNLDTAGEQLDEVILTKKRESENLISTSYGKQNADAVGYDVDSIGDDDIKDINSDNVSSAVEGKFSSVTGSQARGLSRAQIRTQTSILGNTNPLIVIDGIPTVRSPNDSIFNQNLGVESFVDPENIAEITVLKSAASTNKYGALGVNGVIQITTKTAQKAKLLGIKKEEVPIGTTETYSGNAEVVSELADTPYINVLRDSKSVDEAYNSYLQQRAKYGDQASFYLDVADYFKGWNNQFIINRILSNVLEVAIDDIPMLRALAYKYEVLGQQEAATTIYKYILDNASNQAQSYRDLALSYSKEGKIEEAFGLYQQIGSGSLGVTSFNGIQESIIKEARNFVSKHKRTISTALLNTNYQQDLEKLHKRIVIEWNNPNAEFDLQIVNPQNRYFTWPHTQKEAAQRLSSEANSGYNMEEFFITEADKGQWAFNVINYGLLKGDVGQPVYIKFTVYNNFGTPQEQQEVKLVRLSEIDKELNVLNIKV